MPPYLIKGRTLGDYASSCLTPSGHLIPEMLPPRCCGSSNGRSCQRSPHEGGQQFFTKFARVLCLGWQSRVWPPGGGGGSAMQHQQSNKRTVALEQSTSDRSSRLIHILDLLFASICDMVAGPIIPLALRKDCYGYRR